MLTQSASSPPTGLSKGVNSLEYLLVFLTVVSSVLTIVL